MAGIGDAITGKTARRQASMAEAAQRRQAKELAAEREKIAKIEGAQRANRRGGAGLLAYTGEDENLGTQLGDAAATAGASNLPPQWSRAMRGNSPTVERLATRLKGRRSLGTYADGGA